MLTSVDRAIIDLERTWWQVPGSKEWAMLEGVGMDAADYYRRLVDLVWTEGAHDYDPLTVRRLRRLISPIQRAADSP